TMLTEQQALNQFLAEQIGAQTKTVTEAIRAFLDAFDARAKRNAWQPLDSNGPAVDLLVSPIPARLHTAIFYNSSSSRRYVQVHNRHCIAPEKETPKLILPIDGDSVQAFDFGDAGAACGNGIYLCGSSTNTTKTIITSNEIAFHCNFSF